MNDAGEVLLTLYERVRGACEAAGLASAPDAIFGLEVTEAVRCSCGVTSHEHGYTQVGGRVCMPHVAPRWTSAGLDACCGVRQQYALVAVTSCSHYAHCP